MLFSHFLIGVIAADVYLGRPFYVKPCRVNRHDVFVLLAVTWIVVTLAVGTRLPGLNYMQFMWPTFSILIAVLLVSLPQTMLLRPMIDGRFMRLTATLSYGIYIWHVPILVGLKQIWPSTPDGRISMVALYSLTALACSYAVAAISYRVIGKPALDWLRSREVRQPVDQSDTPVPCRAAA
jgi:peptidoglycan/LPS O-acetylase OafA/YrhL